MLEDRYLQVMAHMYRGEMNRMMTYRQRLDTTLQYSVMVSSSMMIFYMGSVVPHPGLPLLVVLYLWVFLFIETRRYRYFLMSRSRIRWFEKIFFLEKAVMNREPSMESLAYLHERRRDTAPWWPCLCVRLCRYYIWLIDVVLLGWWLGGAGSGFVPVAGAHAALHLLVPFYADRLDF